MKRRDFFHLGLSGVISADLTGCSVFRPHKYEITQPEWTPLEFDKMVSKPYGTMPMAEIGSTGIEVSKFGFGSHMHRKFLSYEKEREWMVREAFDLGVNFYDIYDVEGRLFQYEPMGRYLKEMIHDVVISVTMHPLEGLTINEEMERDLRLLGRDYIDLIRIHAWEDSSDKNVLKRQSGHRWDWWETLFKYKEKGYVRAVGVPIHKRENLDQPLAELPIDFVMLPFNFYHNWYAMAPHDYRSTINELEKRGIGIITMKPFLGDRLATPFHRISTQLDKNGDISFPQACLRYIINTDARIDSTLVGMNNPFQVYENSTAFFKPEMSGEEQKLLKKIRKNAKITNVSELFLPEQYKFLNDWVPALKAL